MNKPTNKEIEEVLAGIASPELAQKVSAWLATEEGCMYLSQSMDEFQENYKEEKEALYLDHSIPSLEMYASMMRKIKQQQQRKLFYIAAAVLIPFAVLFFTLYPMEKTLDPLEQEYRELVVDHGRNAEVVFQDGTTVTLNAGSRLRYPTQFQSSRREVFLEGEAFFEVKKDKKHPFIVHLDKGDVEVLGTVFNVNTFKKQIDVVLLEGKISFNTEKKQRYVLLPGNRLLFDKEKMLCEVKKMEDPSDIAKWKEHIFFFQNTPFSDVKDVLSRWYNVEFEIHNNKIYHYSFTLESPKGALTELLHELETISGVSFTYDVTRNHVIVK